MTNSYLLKLPHIRHRHQCDASHYVDVIVSLRYRIILKRIVNWSGFTSGHFRTKNNACLKIQFQNLNKITMNTWCKKVVQL